MPISAGTTARQAVHYHLACRGCGRTEDAERVLGEPPCLEPAGADGFVIDGVEVIFWGTCPACQAADSSPTVQPSVSP